MGRQPSVNKQQQSKTKAPAVGESGVGIAPSVQNDPAADKVDDRTTEFKAPNTAGQQGTERHTDGFTMTQPDDEHGGVAGEGDDLGITADVADDDEDEKLEAARLNAPDGDDDEDPDAELALGANGVDEEAQDVEEDDDEEVLVALAHENGLQHINGHPLEGNTVVRMKRGDVKNHRDHGVCLIDVDDDYDGEVYDVSEPYKPEQDKDEAA